MTADPRDPPNAPPDAPQRRSGQTTSVKDAAPSSAQQPEQPHERDESSASQEGAPTEVMKKAHDDVERGLSDTSRAEATDRTYADNLRGRGGKR
jgi:hypothetical protein